jgi:hypothetical protein
MLALAAFSLLAAAPEPAPATADYPLPQVLAAFATACSGTEDTAVNIASATAAGWERLPADAETPISRLVRQGRDALAAADPEAEMLDGGEFRKIVAGRTLYLAISSVRIDEITARGCRLFDFAAPRAPTAEELERWAVRTPIASSGPEGASKFTWNPGLKPGHMEMEIIFLRPGTQPLPGFDISGLALIASALEF